MTSRAATIAIAALVTSAPAGPLHAQQLPWLTAELSAAHDNQPRDALRLRVEYGRFVLPNATLAGHATGSLWDARAAGEESATAEVGATGTVGWGGFGVALTGSALLGTPTDATTELPVLADAQLRFQPGADVSFRARLTRDRYTATSASLDTLVLVHGVELALDRAAAPGWAGELVARREWFDDGNPVSTAFGWLLAPLSRGTGHAVRAGYGVGWQDSDASNWVAVETSRGGPGPAVGAQPAEVPGRYDPYYTPHDVVTHTALANVALALGDGWLVLDGAYGYGTEIAPTLRSNAAGTVVLQFSERSFTPYRATARWNMPLGDLTSLELRSEHSRTPFYRLTTVRVSLARSLPGG